MSTFAVIDFETTGLSPDYGDRATEVAVVLMSRGEVVDRYQSLINPQRPIPAFVQSLTGITDAMVRKAPDAANVMQELHSMLGATPLIAHNASFDRKFLDAEYSRAGLRRQAEVACSMLLSRRVYPDFPNHKLGTLVAQLSLPNTGTYHRALADAEMTAHLMTRIIAELRTRHGLKEVTFDVLRQLQSVARNKFAAALSRFRH